MDRKERTALEEWLRTEAAAAYDELAADPSRGLSIDQVRAELAETRRRFEALNGE
ncbi:MAG TPA: hypothetical protein VIT45_08385 [Allosphingosinicella sp.]